MKKRIIKRKIHRKKSNTKNDENMDDKEYLGPIEIKQMLENLQQNEEFVKDDSTFLRPATTMPQFMQNLYECKINKLSPIFCYSEDYSGAISIIFNGKSTAFMSQYYDFVCWIETAEPLIFEIKGLIPIKIPAGTRFTFYDPVPMINPYAFQLGGHSSRVRIGYATLMSNDLKEKLLTQKPTKGPNGEFIRWRFVPPDYELSPPDKKSNSISNTNSFNISLEEIQLWHKNGYTYDDINIMFYHD